MGQGSRNSGVGQPLPHESADLHVTGQALYTDDLVHRTPRVLHAHPICSPHAHARVTGLDVAPVVPAVRWAPYGVAVELLGDQGAACAGSRARVCPVPGHPCLAGVSAEEAVAAALRLRALPRSTPTTPTEAIA